MMMSLPTGMVMSDTEENRIRLQADPTLG